MFLKTSQILILILATYAGQNDRTEMQVDRSISAADRNDILKLAKQFGIENPQAITKGSCIPGTCRFVSVASRVAENGHRRTWSELLVCNKKWGKQCPAVSSNGEITKRQGQWKTNKDNLAVREEWRIEDQGWHVDISPREVTSFEDVRLIVLAIRRGELINRLSENDTLPQIDAYDISTVEKQNFEPKLYRVYLGRLGGEVLTVRIVGGKVELLLHGIWLV